MSARLKMTSWFRRMLGRRRLEAEMREEMEFHRQERAADLMSRGASRADAERQSRLEFGNVGGYEEECRTALGFRLLDELRADVRYAARGVRKSPGFSVVAVAILALALGANCVIFTLYSNFVLKPLPIRGADRHFEITGRSAKSAQAGRWRPAEVEALRVGVQAQVEGLYSADMVQVLMVAPEQRQVMVMAVSGNYFRLLGVGTILGRTFGEDEERAPLAVLSEAGWRKLTGSDPHVVGKTVRVRSTVFAVVGVAQPEFTGTEAAAPDFWVPRGMQRSLRGEGPGSQGNEPGARLSGLVRPGVRFEEVQEALTAIASRFERPEESRVARVEVTPRPSYLPDNQELQAVSVMVFTAFLLVLLIACANLANLYLSRASARTHEIGVRLSLGASRWRVVRQLLTESALTALLGAAAGLALAALGIGKVQEYVFSSLAALEITILPVSIDWRVSLYAACLGGLAGIAFGLLPAIEATNPSLVSATKREHSHFAGRVRPRRLRNLLIGGQVAVSLLLLIVSGLLIRNIQRLEAMEAGYDLDRVLDVKVQWPNRALLERLGQVEGVVSVSGVNRVPLYGRLDRRAALVNGVTEALGSNIVDERYFETLGLRVIDGRGFTRHETEIGARVAVVSAATARKLWPGPGSAVGGSIELVEGGSHEVVGIVPDVVSGWFFEGPDSTLVYLPGAAGSREIDSAIVRVTGNVGKAAASIRKVCAEAGGCEPMSLRAVATLQRFPFQVAAAVAGLLGSLALLLTGVGLYGVVGYSVVQRRKEIGVYVALGATPWRVVWRIMAEAGRCVAGGVAVGLPVCLMMSKLAASAVFQVRTFDVGAYVAVPLLLAVVTAVACLGPASRAARVDAMQSLREE